MDPIFEIKTDKQEGNKGTFILTPLQGGYGHTLGVALRRVMLTSLPGTAVTSVTINGVKHQFTTLTGMKEDILEFILNLKKVRFSQTGQGVVKATLVASKPGEVKASDIKTSSSLKVVNPDLVLANLAKGAKLDVEMEVSNGVGYSPADERVKESVGVIPVDAIFSPVVRVNYKVEETRVGRVTNYDQLVLEVTTDGTISPLSALTEAAKILVSYFSQIVTPQAVVKEEKAVKVEDGLGNTGKLSVEEIGLPTRVSNALVNAGYENVSKLVAADRADLAKVRNLGEKSFKIIKVALAEKGVEFNA